MAVCKNQRKHLENAHNAKSNTKRRLSRSHSAVARREQRRTKWWKSTLDVLDTVLHQLVPTKGKEKTNEQEKMNLMVVIAYVRQNIEMNKQFTWTLIENEVARDLHIRSNYVSQLRQQFLDEGELIHCEYLQRGFKSGSFAHPKTKMTNEIVKDVASYVESVHSQGKTVSARMVNIMLQQKHLFTVDRKTIRKTLKRLGLEWSYIKPKPRTFASHRHEHLRNYLIQLDSYMKEMKAGNERGLVFVFTDESYIHQNHKSNMSYLNKDQCKNGVDRKKAKAVA